MSLALLLLLVFFVIFLASFGEWLRLRGSGTDVARVLFWTFLAAGAVFLVALAVTIRSLAA